jgi:serine protease Do
MKQHGRASSVALAGFLGVVVGAVLVWAVVRRGPAPVAGPGGSTPMQAQASPGVSVASQDAITAAVQKVGPAVANISVLFQPQQQSQFQRRFGIEPFPRAGQGSGVIIDGKKGYLLTNAHVVKGAQKVMVTLADGRQFEAQVVGIDPLTEVAVVKVPGDDLPQAELGSAEKLPIGSWVIAIGNPFGLENSVTVGVLSAKERQVPNPNGIALQGLLQTDASINPGNSGGALVDLSGKLVGMPTAVIPYAQGIGFAVSIDVAKQIADRLIQTGKAPWLGIEHKSVTPEQAKKLGVPTGKGTVVFWVYPDGPAAQAGLQFGDLIVRVAGQVVTDEKTLGDAIRAHNAGDRIEITVVRKGREMTLTATLGAVPATIGGG